MQRPRGWRLVALVLGVLLTVGSVGCGFLPRIKDKQQIATDDMIAGVAADMDKAHVKRADADLMAKLTIPAKPTRTQMEQYVEVADSEWYAYLKALLGPSVDDLKLPASFGLLGNTVMLPADTQVSTKCVWLTKNKPTFTSAARTPIYCPFDTGAVRSIPDYVRGTRWLPLDGMYAVWADTHATPIEIQQAFFAYLAASWADAYTRQIEVYAYEKLKVSLPVQHDPKLALRFGYCIAGALARATFSPGTDAVAKTLRTIYGADAATALPDYEGDLAGLMTGYLQGHPGDCMRSHWPDVPSLGPPPPTQ